jgi:lipocalin
MSVFWITFALAILALQSSVIMGLHSDLGGVIPPDTVNSLNLTSYYGRWFQMYASKLPNTTIEKNGYCVTADHFAMANENNIAFGLVNSLR